MLLLYLIIIFIYSFYCNKIDLIRKTNLKDNTIRINCNYEIYCLIIKIIINIFYFFVNIKKDNSLYIIIYQCLIIINFHIYKKDKNNPYKIICLTHLIFIIIILY